MPEEKLQKSYRGLILWTAAFLALMTGVLLMKAEEALMMRLFTLLLLWSMVVLCLVVEKLEAVYWFNGTTFEEAEAAGSQRRRDFARRHLDRFLWAAQAVSLLVAVSYVLHWPWWIDFTAATLGVIVAALSTVPLKL